MASKYPGDLQDHVLMKEARARANTYEAQRKMNLQLGENWIYGSTSSLGKTLTYEGEDKSKISAKKAASAKLERMELHSWHLRSFDTWMPDAVAGSTIDVIGDWLYLFGGMGGAQGTGRSNAIARLPLNAGGHWELMEITGWVPPPRAGHSSVTIQDKIWVFGGEGRVAGLNDRQTFNDFVVFDPSTKKWVRPDMVGVPPFNRVPSARREHTFTHVESKDGEKIVLFGGIGPDRMFGQDMFMDEVFILDVASRVWSEGNLGGQKPCPRAGHSATFVASTHTMYVFGGLFSPIKPTRLRPRAANDVEPPHTMDTVNEASEAKASFEGMERLGGSVAGAAASLLTTATSTSTPPRTPLREPKREPETLALGMSPSSASSSRKVPPPLSLGASMKGLGTSARFRIATGEVGPMSPMRMSSTGFFPPPATLASPTPSTAPSTTLASPGDANMRGGRGIFAPEGVYGLDTHTWEWKLLRVSGSGPGAVHGHQALADPGGASQIYVFGGKRARGLMVDTMFLLDVAALAWSSVDMTGPAPGPRVHHNIVQYKQSLIVFGGMSSSTYHDASVHTMRLADEPAIPRERPVTPRISVLRVAPQRAQDRTTSLVTASMELGTDTLMHASKKVKKKPKSRGGPRSYHPYPSQEAKDAAIAVHGDRAKLTVHPVVAPEVPRPPSPPAEVAKAPPPEVEDGFSDASTPRSQPPHEDTPPKRAPIISEARKLGVSLTIPPSAPQIRPPDGTLYRTSRRSKSGTTLDRKPGRQRVKPMFRVKSAGSRGKVSQFRTSSLTLSQMRQLEAEGWTDYDAFSSVEPGSAADVRPARNASSAPASRSRTPARTPVRSSVRPSSAAAGKPRVRIPRVSSAAAVRPSTGTLGGTRRSTASAPTLGRRPAGSMLGNTLKPLTSPLIALNSGFGDGSMESFAGDASYVSGALRTGRSVGPQSSYIGTEAGGATSSPSPSVKVSKPASPLEKSMALRMEMKKRAKRTGLTRPLPTKNIAALNDPWNASDAPPEVIQLLSGPGDLGGLIGREQWATEHGMGHGFGSGALGGLRVVTPRAKHANHDDMDERNSRKARTLSDKMVWTSDVKGASKAAPKGFGFHPPNVFGLSVSAGTRDMVTEYYLSKSRPAMLE